MHTLAHFVKIISCRHLEREDINMSDCLFCNIASGDIPSATIYEDREFKVFLDAFPGTEGHVLIIPKKHVANIFELDEQTGAKLFALATKVARVLKDKLDFDGMNVVQNNGQAAGQTIFHFHMHLVPRYRGDGVTIGWNAAKADERVLAELTEALKVL